jgi:hypothetical protein
MRNLLLLLCAMLLSFSAVGAQTPAQPAGRDLQVQLTSAIKAKKAKVGDVVSAVTVIPVTLAQGVAVPAGSKVTGHVRQVEADSGDAHTSFIALSFDEVALKHGQTVSLNSFVRAALMPALRGTTAQESQQGQTMAPMQSPTRGGMMNGGMGGPMGGMMSAPPMGNSNPPTATSTPPAQPQEPAKPVAARTGEIIGMRGVELQVTNPEHLSVFRSVHKNLELDEGLQLMLVVQ